MVALGAAETVRWVCGLFASGVNKRHSPVCALLLLENFLGILLVFRLMVGGEGVLVGVAS